MEYLFVSLCGFYSLDVCRFELEEQVSLTTIPSNLQCSSSSDSILHFWHLFFFFFFFFYFFCRDLSPPSWMCSLILGSVLQAQLMTSDPPRMLHVGFSDIHAFYTCLNLKIKMPLAPVGWMVRCDCWITQIRSISFIGCGSLSTLEQAPYFCRLRDLIGRGGAQRINKEKEKRKMKNCECVFFFSSCLKQTLTSNIPGLRLIPFYHKRCTYSIIYAPQQRTKTLIAQYLCR